MADRPYETRTVTADLEVREMDDAPVLTGYAATFDRSYRVGGFEERIDPSAFARTLAAQPDVRLLIDHEGQPLARTKSGTLELSADGHGLQVRATLDPTDPDVQRLLPKMRRGDLDQMSFAFRVPSGGDVWDHSGEMPQRTIREAVLHGGDVSVVTYPANEGTAVSVRSRDVRDANFVYLQHMIDELRAATAVSDVDMTRLRQVLDLIAAADEAVDAAQPVLADVLGVPNPDADDEPDDAARSTSLDLARRHVEALALRARRA